MNLNSVFKNTFVAQTLIPHFMKTILYSILAVWLGMNLNPLQAQNLSEGFEGTFPPEDWTIINQGDANTWTKYTSSSSAHSGSASARISYSTTAHDDWLITPKLTIMSAQDSIHFWAKNHTASFLEEFRVKVSTETPLIADFTHILDTLASPGTSWEKFSYDLSAFNGQDIYIAIEAISTNEYHLYVDDFSGPTLFVPSCQKTDSINITGITSSSADFTWPAISNAQTYFVNVFETGTTPSSGTAVFTGTVSTNAISATGLSDNIAYTVYVNTICSATDTSEARTATFSTLCTPYSTLDETFEDLDGANLPDCWSAINNATTTYATVKATTYGSPSNGSNHIRLFNSSDANAEQYLITPQLIGLANGTHRMRFVGKNGGSGERMVIGTMSDAQDASTFTLVDTIELTSSEVEYTYNFTQVTSDPYLAFHHVANSSTDRIYVDNVVWEPIPSCYGSSMVNGQNITSNSIDLFWNNPSSANQFIIEYGEEGFTLGSGMLVTSTDTFATIPSLLPATSYDFYVKVVCSSTDSSVYSTVYSAQTNCIALPEVIESFETTSGTELPICWNTVINSTSTYTYIQSTTTGSSADGSRQIVFYNSSVLGTGSDLMLISPELNTLSNKRLRFNARGNSGGVIKVGSITDPTDASTFIPIDSFVVSGSHQEYEVILNGTYSGNHLTFKAEHTTAYTYMYVDHVRLTDLPTCLEPTNVLASVISQTEAEITWTANSGESQWVIEYGNTGFILGSGQVEIATTNPFVVDGLTYGDTLDFYVKALCSATDTSVSSNVMEGFIMECAPEVGVYTEDFASFLPDCWSIAKGTLSTSTQLTSDAGTSSYSWKADGFQNNGTAGAAKINIYGGGSNHWLISNSIQLQPNHTRVLEFDAALTDFGNSNAPEDGSFGDDDRVVVVVSTDNGLTWTSDNILMTLDTTNAPSHLGEHYTIDLSAYSGAIRIAFYGESTLSNEDNDFFIDNFEITETPPVLVNDITGISVVVESEYCLNEGIISAVTVENTGDIQITEFDVEMTLVGAQIFTFSETFTTTLDVDSQETIMLSSISGLPSGVYTASVTIMLPNDSIATNNTVTTTLTVLTPEVITINEDITICEGESVVLNGNGSALLEWSGNLTNGSSVSPMSTTTYTCTAISPEGCIVTESFTITVETLNVPTIEFNNGILSTIGLYSTYEWSFNGAVVSQVSTFEPTDNGVYTVVVTNNNGCSVQGTFIVQGLSIEFYDINEISVYPNPTNGIVTLSHLDIQVSVNVMNSYGQQIETLISEGGQINLVHLPKGMYMLQYIYKDEVYVAKVQKL